METGNCVILLTDSIFMEIWVVPDIYKKIIRNNLFLRITLTRAQSRKRARRSADSDWALRLGFG